ncbi:hypothetical protein GTV15_22585 [Streptomyces sp. SID7803]|nr:hypothetical protein [Streptomyces sp. SID7803]
MRTSMSAAAASSAGGAQGAAHPAGLQAALARVISERAGYVLPVNRCAPDVETQLARELGAAFRCVGLGFGRIGDAVVVPIDVRAFLRGGNLRAVHDDERSTAS